MSKPYSISMAKTTEEIAHCYSVIFQLRGNLSESEYMERVQQQMQEGYQLVYLESGGQVKSAAGFHFYSMLSRGRYMYVDELVSDETARSQGWGKYLLDWLKEFARQHGCHQVDLDSGVQRFDAHRFYFREGLFISSYHFRMMLNSGE